MIDLKALREFDYPVNLYLSLGIKVVDIPINAEEILFTILNTPAFSDKEVITLFEYFKDHKTLVEISESYSVSRERIRQIIQKTVSKLEKFKPELLELTDLYTTKQQLEKQIEILKRELEVAKENAKEYNIKIDEIHIIEELNLSHRSYNCLKRNEIETVNQLALMTASKLKKIKNLGDRSVNEIVHRLNDKFGIKIPED